MEITTSSKSTAYMVMSLAVLFGSGSLLAFLVFLLAGSPELIRLNLRASEVLWWDAGLSMAFFIQHSGMVRRSFRRWLARFLPEEYAGALYAIVSGIVLLAVIALWQKSSVTFLTVNGVLRWLFYIAYVLAIAGFIWGITALGAFDPYGLRPLLGRLRDRKSRTMQLTIRGPYHWVRHPLYLFMILMIWSCPDLTADRLFFNGLWTIWMVIGAMLEERDLISEFGDAYRAYQRRVPLLIPRRLDPI
jgi:protein-S-isoprenylcysteine O-methyltransferase Ste14